MIRLAPMFALAACTFQPNGNGSAAIIDDTAADFADADALVGATVAKRGAIEPRAYAPPGLHARGFVGVHVDLTTTWDSLTSVVLGPPTGSRYGMGLDESFGIGRPLGVGITGNHAGSYTVLYDGEIYLPAGTTSLLFQADDAGFIQFDIAGTWTAELRASYPVPAGTMGSVTTTAAGWYPIRGAYSQGGGDRYFKLFTVDGTNPPVPFDLSALRADVTDASGAIVTEAIDRYLGTPTAATSVELDALDRNFQSGPTTYDLSDTFDNFSLRYAGQLLIDTTDVYVLSAYIGLDSNDSYRIFLDGNLVASRWPSLPTKVASDSLPVTAGWHDLVVDYAETNNASTIVVELARGAGGAEPVLATQLRPAIAHGNFAAVVGGNLGVSGFGASAMETVALAVPDSALIDFVDFAFTLLTTGRDGYATTIVAPAGNISYMLPPTPAYDGTIDYTAVRTELAGKLVDAATGWQLAIAASAADPAGTMTTPELVVSYHGGPNPPFAPELAYTSGKRAIPEGATISAIHLDADLRGAALAVSIRTGSADEIDALPWQVVQPDADLDVSSGEVVQYLIAISGDGWALPSVDRVEIDYR